MKKWILPLILLLGCALRLINISTRGIEYDDAFSIFLSERSFSQIISGTAADTMPPAYYFLLHVWMLVSKEIWFIRISGIIINLLSIIVIFKIMYDFVSHTSGYWAALLASISPFMIYHAQDVRGYALLLLGLGAYYWFFLKLYFWINKFRREPFYWIGLILSGTLAMYTHNIAVFFLIAPLFYLLLFREWKWLINFSKSFFCILILFSPWAIILVGQINKVQHAFWTLKPGLIQVVQLFIVYTSSLPLPNWSLNLSVFLTFVALIFISMGLRRILTKQDPLHILFYIFILPLVLLFIVSYITRPMLIPRVTIASAFVYYCLAAAVIADKDNKNTAPIIAGCFIICAIISIPYQMNYSEFPRSPFNAAAAQLGKNQGIDRIIIHQNKLSYFPTRFYQPALDQVFLGDKPGSMNDTLAYGSEAAMGIYHDENIQLAARNKNKVDYVVFRNVLDEFDQMDPKGDPDLAWLKNNYELAGEHNFNDLLVYSFSRP